MTLAATMLEIWQRALVEDRSEFEISGRMFKVTRSRGQGLRVVPFSYEGLPIVGIEQNPEKTSRWAKLAQQGQRIMQFSYHRRFVANVCEGRLTRYSSWESSGLPE